MNNFIKEYPVYFFDTQRTNPRPVITCFFNDVKTADNYVLNALSKYDYIGAVCVSIEHFIVYQVMSRIDVENTNIDIRVCSICDFCRLCQTHYTFLDVPYCIKKELLYF